jgi:hypothetical protein
MVDTSVELVEGAAAVIGERCVCGNWLESGSAERAYTWWNRFRNRTQIRKPCGVRR